MPRSSCRSITNSIQSSNFFKLIEPQQISALSRQLFVVKAGKTDYLSDRFALPQSLYSILISKNLYFLYPVRQLLVLSSTQYIQYASIDFIFSLKSTRSSRFCLVATLYTAFFENSLSFIILLILYSLKTILNLLYKNY